MCTNTALLIPTTASPNVANDQTEAYCGSYLNVLNGNMVSGTVTGAFKCHHIFFIYVTKTKFKLSRRSKNFNN